METSWLRELRSPPGEGPFLGGNRQLDAGFRLLRRDRTILTLTLIGALALTAISIGFFYLDGQSGPLARDGDRIFRQLLFGSASLAVMLLMSLSVACAADARVDGAPGGIRLVLGEVRERLAALLGWWAISLVAFIGLGLGAYALFNPLAAFLAVNALWGIGTFFVVSAMAIEGGGTISALTLGLRLLRASWGRVLVALLLLACLYFFVSIPVVMLVRAGADRYPHDHASGLWLYFGGLALFYLTATATIAARESFALIRARDVLDDLPGEPKPREPREWRRMSLRRVVFGAIGLVALLFVAGAIFGRGKHRDSSSISLRQPITTVPRVPSGATPGSRADHPGHPAASRRTFEARPTGEWVATGHVLTANRVNGLSVGEVLHRRWRFVTSCAGGPCRSWLLRTSSTGIQSSPLRFRPHNYLAEFGNRGSTCEVRPGWFSTFSVTFSIWWTKHRTQLVAEEMGGFNGGPACPYAGERIRWTAHPLYGAAPGSNQELL
jgi:hypothetical protein